MVKKHELLDILTTIELTAMAFGLSAHPHEVLRCKIDKLYDEIAELKRELRRKNDLQKKQIRQQKGDLQRRDL